MFVRAVDRSYAAWMVGAITNQLQGDRSLTLVTFGVDDDISQLERDFPGKRDFWVLFA